MGVSKGGNWIVTRKQIVTVAVDRTDLLPVRPPLYQA